MNKGNKIPRKAKNFKGSIVKLFPYVKKHLAVVIIALLKLLIRTTRTKVLKNFVLGIKFYLLMTK